MNTILFSSRLSHFGGTIRRLQIWLRYCSPNYRVTVIVGLPLGIRENGLVSNGKQEGVEVIEVKARGKSLIMLRMRAAKELVRRLKTGTYGTVMPVLSDSDIVGFIVVRMAGWLYSRRVRFVCHCAGSPVPVKMLGTWRGRLFRSILRVVYKNSDEIVVINQTLKDTLVNDYGVDVGQVRVIPISVECDARDQKDEILRQAHVAPEFRFGVLSRLTREKSVHHVIEASRELAARDCKARIVIYGDGPELDHLKSLVSEFGVVDAVEFAGWTSRPEDAIKGMDCLILPSQMEGTPRSILEAGCRGVPTIASSVGGIPELIDHDQTGWLYHYGDVDTLRNLMISVCENPARTKQIGEAMQRLVLTHHSPKVETSAIAECWNGTAIADT